MKNKVLDELWLTKDQISKESNYDIDTLAKELKKSQKDKKHKGVDLSHKNKSAA